MLHIAAAGGCPKCCKYQRKGTRGTQHKYCSCSGSWHSGQFWATMSRLAMSLESLFCTPKIDRPRMQRQHTLELCQVDVCRSAWRTNLVDIGRASAPNTLSCRCPPEHSHGDWCFRLWRLGRKTVFGIDPNLSALSGGAAGPTQLVNLMQGLSSASMILQLMPLIMLIVMMIVSDSAKSRRFMKLHVGAAGWIWLSCS